MTTTRVELDEPKCVASGQCVLAAPDVFDQRDDDGVAVLLEEYPGEELLHDARQAEAVCPAAAIRLVER
ncbi:ferredoxin [Streptomyces sp. NPDC085927]|uniref:ferredoxin n=1 Tax=unclassified Streptomyces TaxID=2593676 RepID=UPI002FC64AE2